MDIPTFIQALQQLNLSISQKQLDQFQRYAHLLQEWNQKMNLTAITKWEDILEKHFYDCILPLEKVDLSQKKVGDVGSGAGFPGVVWKIMVPDCHMVLIEPLQKRCTFLRHVIEELGLQDIEVVNQRSEDHVAKYRETYDVITSRAVANLNVLSELCIPLIKIGGLFITLKGAKGLQEHQNASHALKILGVETYAMLESQLHGEEQRVNLYYQKVQHTPLTYPRNYGQIKKKPL